MTQDELRAAVIDAITRVAPEVDPASIAGDVHLRDELDLDSMDFLNVMLSLHARLGVEIPETDYRRLYTLDGAVQYLSTRLQQASAATTPNDSHPADGGSS